LKVLDRYILREFFKIFALAVAGSTLLTTLVDVIEKIDTFIDKEAGLSDVLLFYLYKAPYTAILTLPAAMLIATIFAVGQCNRWNEITAMKASGISLYRALFPLFITSFLISILVFIIGETVLPFTNNAKQEIYDHHILKRAEARGKTTSIHYQGKRGVLYSIQRYHADEERMDDVTVVRKDPHGKLIYRIDARRGEWKKNRWLLKDGYLRYFTTRDEEVTFRFAILTSRDLKERPGDFMQPPKRPEDMNYLELSRYIDNQKREGTSTSKNEVYLRLKIAFPFANLIIVLFGAPLATISKRGGAATNFGVSLLVFILFWGFIQISRALGDGSTVPPIIAAWIPNIVFGSTGLAILLKIRK